ncbi:phospholipase A and acyltransferase 1 isoform X2 [Pithys albifrons albifrons]|uniref:phospholipase A and acyltransferase 1 isoform X2 n=1 Tax=Pithys albifrons albifrons TaxID=3385563 RepID=UPI003A5CD214
MGRLPGSAGTYPSKIRVSASSPLFIAGQRASSPAAAPTGQAVGSPRFAVPCAEPTQLQGCVVIAPSSDGILQVLPRAWDLIEIKRSFYQHWALYLGNGYVIHVTPVDEGAPSSLFSSASVPIGKAKVKKEHLSKVVKGGDWHVSNKYDRSHTPQIIRQAQRYIDKEVYFNVFTNNCEHFVTKLRYGKELSDHAEQIPDNLCVMH